MAKKKAAAIDFPPAPEPAEPAKRAAPEKPCVKCGKHIHARQMVCPFCKTEQPKKEGSAKPKAKPEGSAKPKSDAMATLILVAKLAGELGGLEKLLELTEQIDALGGSGEVLEAVEALQGLKNLDL